MTAPRRQQRRPAPPGSDAGSATIASFVVGAAIFIIGGIVLLDFAMDPPGGDGEGLAQQDLKNQAERTIEIVVGTPGYPTVWDQNQSAIENLTRLGLVESGATIRLDPDKFDALARGRYLFEDGTNGYVDYAEAKRKLGLESQIYDFHLRAYPSFPQEDADTYGVTGMSTYRVAYLGDFTGAVSSPEADAERDSLDALPMDFLNTVRATVVGPGDVFPDDSTTLKSVLVPLLGGSVSQTIINNGTGTKYDFAIVDEEVLDDALSGTLNDLSHGLALANGDELGYTKSRELRALLGTANFSGLASATLTWNEHVDTGDDAGDYGFIEVSPDDGATWYPITNDAAQRSRDTGISTGLWTPRTATINAGNCNACLGVWDVIIAFHWVADTDTTTGEGWLADDLQLAPTAVTGFHKTFDEPEYDLLVVGSNVDQTAMTPAEVKNGVRDFVNEYGGRILVLGGQTNTQWLEPLFNVGVHDSSPGVANPDSTHPMLTVPNELDWQNYDYGDKAWRFSGGTDEDLFNMIVGDGGDQHILSTSVSGAFGESDDEGVVILTTYLPYNFPEEQRNRFFANAVTYGRYHGIYMEVGPEVPTDLPVATATRSATIDKSFDGSGDYTEITFVLYMWRGNVSASTNEDTVVPSQPRNLQAFPGEGYVSLIWEAPMHFGDTALTDYEVYRGTTSGGETHLATVPMATPLYNDTNVDNGVTYYYHVRARNAGGEGSSSTEASATPTTIPGAPQSLAATGAVGQILLTWTAPLDSGGSSITGYEIYRGASPGSLALIGEAGAETSYTDLDRDGSLAASTQYYEVRALNAAGRGPASNQASASAVALAPPFHSALTATPGIGEITIGWTNFSDEDEVHVYEWNVYRSTTTGSGFTLIDTLREEGSLLSYTDTVAAGQTRYYRVSAINVYGEGNLSAEASAMSVGLPSGPTLTATRSTSTGQIDLSWTASLGFDGLGVDGYIIYAGDTNGALVEIDYVGSAVLSYQETGLAHNATRYYAVAAMDAGVGATNSSTQSAQAIGVPYPPTNLEATYSLSGITLTWVAPVNNGGSAITHYEIWRTAADGASGTETLLDTTVGPILTDLDGSVTATKTYRYYVKAVNAAGASNPSNEATETASL